jgi:hypothetical protein
MTLKYLPQYNAPPTPLGTNHGTQDSVGRHHTCTVSAGTPGTPGTPPIFASHRIALQWETPDATQQLHLTDIRAAISIPDEVAAGSYL